MENGVMIKKVNGGESNNEKDDLVAYFDNAFDVKGTEVSLFEALTKIEDGTHSELIQKIRAAGTSDDKGEYQRLKKNLPLIIPAALFDGKGKATSNVVEKTGLIVADFDEFESLEHMQTIKEEFEDDPYLLAGYVSAGGEGLKTIHRYDQANYEHSGAFHFVKDYFNDKYGIRLDEACKDLVRGTFLSYDREIIIRHNCELLPLESQPQNIRKNVIVQNNNEDAHTMEKCVRFIEEKQVDYTTNKYNKWLLTSFALVSNFGEEGREYFHRISAISAQYSFDECDKKYSNALRTANGEIPLDYIFYQSRFKQYNGKAKSIYQVIEKVTKMNLKHNRLTGKLEDKNGKELDDRGINTQYLDLIGNGINVSKEGFINVLLSHYVSSYNPLEMCRDKLLSIGLDGRKDSEIVKLLNHFRFMPNDSEPIIESKKMLIYRWLMGIPAALFGENSELILVLIGKKGNGKTEFFYRLLPQELKSYYAVDKLDRGKDSDLLMSEKLIILDDEFSGKSKKDHNHLKALSSMKTFSLRRPYGRSNSDVKRLALLCGTSNPDAVIFDNFGGNRRIIPIKIEDRDFKLFDSINKTLLMAQLCQHWMCQNEEGVEAHKLNKAEREKLEELSYAHYAHSIKKDLILKYVKADESEKNFYTATDIANHIQAKTTLRISPIKIGHELNQLGFVRISRKVHGKVAHGYHVNLLDEHAWSPLRINDYMNNN